MKVTKIRTILKNIDIFFIIMIPVVIATGFIKEYLIVFFSVLLHEFAHVLTAALMGFKVHSLRILATGLNASIDYEASDTCRRVLVYASGPALNTVVSAVLKVVAAHSSIQPEWLRISISINAYLAVFNLLPVLPLDGGRLVNEITAGLVGFFRTEKYMKRLAAILTAMLIILGLVQICGNRHNFSILAIGVYICFLLRLKEGTGAIMNIKHILYRRARLVKKGLYPARILVCMKTTTLGEILKNLDFDRFHLIHVLDTDLKLVKILTEQEIIEGLLNYGIDTSIQDFLDRGELAPGKSEISREANT